MTANQTPDLPAREEQPTQPRGHRRISAIALVAGGLIAGATLAGTLSAAATPTSDPESETSTSRECRRGGPAALDEETAAAVEAAVLADYPDATVKRTMPTPDGYAAHILTADDEHLLVTLDESYAVTGELDPAELRERLGQRLEDEGERLGRMGDRLGHMGERLGRFGDRLQDGVGNSGATQTTTQASSIVV